jgi:hypothetical protein
LTGWQVSPISAGSWALQNELTYMRQHPDILQKMDAVLILSNAGDFGEPSSWASGLPTQRNSQISELLPHRWQAQIQSI